MRYAIGQRFFIKAIVRVRHVFVMIPVSSALQSMSYGKQYEISVVPRCYIVQQNALMLLLERLAVFPGDGTTRRECPGVPCRRTIAGSRNRRNGGGSISR